MDTNTKQSSTNLTENKASMVSRKLWGIESERTRTIESRADGLPERESLKGIDDNVPFLFNNNKEGKKYFVLKSKGSIINLTTGETLING